MEDASAHSHLPFRWAHAEKLWNSYLKEILKKESRLDRWLFLEYKKNKNYGKQDRRWYSTVLFQIIRYLPLIVFVDQKTKVIFSNGQMNSLPFEQEQIFSKLENILQEIPRIHFQSIVQVLCLRCPEIQPSIVATEDQKKIFKWIEEEKENSEFYFCLFEGFPTFFLEKMNKRAVIQNWDIKEKRIFIENHSKRPPIWIRLNKKQDKIKLFNELKAKNISYQRSEVHDESFCLLSDVHVQNLDSFKDGIFEVQDLASQKIVHSIKWNLFNKNTLTAWDVCAGAGGKTLQFAQKENFNIELYASDIRENKIMEAQKRAEKSGLKNIHFFKWDATSEIQYNLGKSGKNEVDLVFVDAPCSSSGVWRRSPDQAYFITEKSLDVLKALQLNILKKSSRYVQKNGLLVYSTCSFFREENEEVVEQFLKENPHFLWIEKTLLGNPLIDSDTLFVAQLQKK